MKIKPIPREASVKAQNQLKIYYKKKKNRKIVLYGEHQLITSINKAK